MQYLINKLLMLFLFILEKVKRLLLVLNGWIESSKQECVGSDTISKVQIQVFITTTIICLQNIPITLNTVKKDIPPL